jgi:hypothetical protein
MSDPLTYDLMLETTGILRSTDVRLRLDRDLEQGQMVEFHGRRWVLTEVHQAGPGADIDRRAIAREFPETAYD